MATTQFDKLLEAFEFANFSGISDINSYVDLETGQTYWVSDEMEPLEDLPDDIETSDRYLMLPDKRDLELGRNLAISFAEEFLLDQYENVAACFRKKGAYAHLKDLLDRHDALAQRHDFKARQTELALRE